MVKQTRAARMIESIRNSMMNFLNMSSEQRIDYIHGYRYLQSYQVTALLQCKKYMTPAEKKALKKVQEELKREREDQNPPQPQ